MKEITPVCCACHNIHLHKMFRCNQLWLRVLHALNVLLTIYLHPAFSLIHSNPHTFQSCNSQFSIRKRCNQNNAPHFIQFDSNFKSAVKLHAIYINYVHDSLRVPLQKPKSVFTKHDTTTTTPLNAWVQLIINDFCKQLSANTCDSCRLIL